MAAKRSVRGPHNGRVTTPKRELERAGARSSGTLSDQLSAHEAVLAKMQRSRRRGRVTGAAAASAAVVAGAAGSWLLGASGPVVAAAVLVATMLVVVATAANAGLPWVARHAAVVLPVAAALAVLADVALLGSAAGAVVGAVAAAISWLFVAVSRRQFRPLPPLPAKYKALLARMPIEVADDETTGMTVVVLPSTASGVVVAVEGRAGEDPREHPDVLAFVNRVRQLRQAIPAELGIVFGGVAIVEGYDGPIVRVADGVWCCPPNRVGATLDQLAAHR